MWNLLCNNALILNLLHSPILVPKSARSREARVALLSRRSARLLLRLVWMAVLLIDGPRSRNNFFLFRNN
jgi:hypothetical protein